MKTIANRLEIVMDGFNRYVAANDLTHWQQQPAPEKWSGKEILGHLIDSANNNLQRFVRGTYEQGFKFVYNQNEWVRCQHYSQPDTSELVQLWTLLNRQIVRVLENYPEEKAAVVANVGQNEPEMLTIREIAESYVEHMLHHMRQMGVMLK